jgi:sulfur-carrier protein adenylyltransferase/sulfurtransferase
MDTNGITFSKEELERYSRHLIIPEFNIQGQRKLKASKVLVVGSGGLGSPVLLYLAAAGVGHIGIVDFDTVDESNLQRQILFGVEDKGKPKVEAALKRLKGLNPHVNFTLHNTRLTSANALHIIKEYDLVADGTDNFATRYLVNDACVLLGKVNVYASIYRFEGQASVFNQLRKDGSRGPNYRDLFPSPPPPGLVPSCAEGGVIGVLPGILGSLQALEVIKVLSGVGDTLDGRLFLFDAASFQTRIVKVLKDSRNPLTGDNPTQTSLIDYEAFCGIGETAQKKPVKEITVEELRVLKESEADFRLIDVREPFEYEIAHLGGELMPLGSIADFAPRIPRDKQVIVHCKGGVRSEKAIRELEEKFGFDNLYNLKGGILEWSKKVDHDVPVY